MTPPASSTPPRRREGGWRDPHQGSSAPYPYDYDAMSPNPYSSNHGLPPPASYHYDQQGPPPPPRGPPGPPPADYWYSPPPYGTEHPHTQPPVGHRGSGGSYWGPAPPSPYDGYRGGPPPPGFLRSAPHGHMNLSSQHQHRTPLRRPYAGEQVGLETRIPPPSPGDHHFMHQNQQLKDFSPPAPAPAVGHAPASRGVEVAVSTSADSEETPVSCPPNQTTTVNTVTPKKEHHPEDDDHSGVNKNSGSEQGKDGKGDPLSVLADVSAGMGGKNKQSKQDTKADGKAVATKARENIEENSSSPNITTPSASRNRPSVPMPAPTSPLQRRFKPSPITPSQTPQVGRHVSKRTPAARKHQPITPSRSHDTASTTEAGSQSLQTRWEPPPLPHGGSGSSGSGELYAAHPEYSGASQQSGAYNTPSRRNRPLTHYGAGEYGAAYPTESPALVERGSFDSHGDASSYRELAPFYPPPSTPNSSRGAYFYDDHPPPLQGYGGTGSGGGPYWDSGQPPYSPTYPPPSRGPGGWNQRLPPPTHSDPFYGQPPHHGPSPPEYSYPPHPPPPHYGGPEDHDAAMYGGSPPLHSSYHHRGAPHPAMPGPHHPGMPMHPSHMSGPPPPYPYSQPPRMEEKTILRKKFSWKHYPELERFLIANRDEYLKHSNMNYTAEQKQYNNWLTERLLEVAGQHNYVFDQEDFNFVAIRDRIRCYYKSYVQTARKRGLKLPEKKALKSKVDATTEVKKEKDANAL